ncbi:MAG: nucleotide exchange factor GrpE [gamma proteobacterium symbiont of Bathyaustriella thionipta]|nr:nucleotide exchange factor GrpE [gamma proteobacterium symbiont of Bathyaustriella thionipta]MCU7948966.1 nucleotide exchange factor GrpE [gamma proteobacterium symbiont of Bathyaustriella thionipta]MCU7953968.1 nucleotide exchange factor GrpE [gamma proteobacterium symbiont of Bathyaustriella thionipta]MCU7955511.1 nucleotide exchange factor GrpE [gamma proteobacterium symbiont of Bathyaustriella thionipta]MCU7965692.1 nucleotide exchange factor GrpE [gamma proteobacterium symbiont of Bathy
MSDEQKAEEQVQDEEIKAQASEADNIDVDDNVNSNADNEEVSDELAALEAEELIARIKQAQSKADENWDVALRTKAEMENVRRRTEKEVANARKFGIEKMINEILPVKDSMELGLKAAVEMDIEDESVHKIREGMELTLKMMVDALTKIGITEIAPEDGDAFSAEFHQAMSMQEIPGKEANTIVAVMQKGYLLNERLIRPAMVMVAR